MLGRSERLPKGDGILRDVSTQRHPAYPTPLHHIQPLTTAHRTHLPTPSHHCPAPSLTVTGGLKTSG